MWYIKVLGVVEFEGVVFGVVFFFLFLVDWVSNWFVILEWDGGFVGVFFIFDVLSVFFDFKVWVFWFIFFVVKILWIILWGVVLLIFFIVLKCFYYMIFVVLFL